MLSIHLTHSFSAAHRLYRHEGACSNVHGHNYVVEFEVISKEEGVFDSVGRVIDFSEVKRSLCSWIDKNWDHQLLLWHEDPLASSFEIPGIYVVPFNPTVEAMVSYLLHEIGPQELPEHLVLVAVTIMETEKCGATERIDL